MVSGPLTSHLTVICPADLQIATIISTNSLGTSLGPHLELVEPHYRRETYQPLLLTAVLGLLIRPPPPPMLLAVDLAGTVLVPGADYNEDETEALHI